METTIEQDLTALGIEDHKDARSTLAEYLLDARLNPQEKARRVDLVKEAQKNFMKKLVRLRSDPNRTGTAVYVRPRKLDSFRKSDGDSELEVFVKWKSSRRGGSWPNLDAVELA